MITRIVLLIYGCLLSYTGLSQATTSGKAKPDEKEILFSTSWNLVEIYGTPAIQPGMQQAYITLQEGEFNYNRLTGFTGCNFIGGKVDIMAGDDITFHPDLITNNNCAGSSVEAGMLQALREADSWSEKNGQILLERKGKIVARLNPSTYQDPNLPGSWQLIYVCDLVAPFSQVFPAAHCPYINFNKGSKVAAGNAGCHEFASTFILNAGSIIFKEATACDTNCAGQEENIFLDRLSRVNGFVFKDGKTLVFIDDNKPIMAFTRRKFNQDSPSTANRE